MFKRRKLNNGSASSSSSCAAGTSTNPPPKILSICEFRMTQRHIISMGKALGNPLILHKIIQYLKLAELKSSRTVNQVWRGIVSRFMLKSGLCRVKLKFDYMSNELLKHHNLDQFNNIFENAIIFPCSDFCLSSPPNLGSPESHKFFTMIFTQLKTLTLTSHDSTRLPKTTKEEFCNIVSHHLRNLEDLTLYHFEYPNWTDEDHLFLPSLKKFTWVACETTACKIIQGAPNLILLRGPVLLDSVMEVLIDSPKLSTVQSLVCDHCVYGNVLLRFALAGPTLQKLTICPNRAVPHLVNPFEILLKRTAGTLETLHLNNFHNYVQLKIPNLTNLKTLKLSQYDQKQQRCLSGRLNLLECFPILQTFDCTGLRCDLDMTWDQYFPPWDAFHGDLPTVKTLKIGACSELWMIRLLSLCQNFKNLVLTRHASLHATIVSALKVFLQLESLEIFALSGNVALNSLDPTFTGLPATKCDFLRSIVIREIDFPGQRVGPCISDLKDLKFLTITVDWHPALGSFPLSHISRLYGFDLLPNIKVKICFCHILQNEELTPIQAMLGPQAQLLPSS